MLKTTDKVLDFTRAQLCSSHTERDGAAQRRLLRGEPVPRRRDIALEELQRTPQRVSMRAVPGRIHLVAAAPPLSSGSRFWALPESVWRTPRW